MFDDFNGRLKIVDGKVTLTLDSDIVALVMDTKRTQFRTMATANNEMYLKMFNVFVWLLSDSEIADQTLKLVSTAFMVDTQGGDVNKMQGMKTVSGEVNLKPKAGSLAQDLFKNVLGKGK